MALAPRAATTASVRPQLPVLRRTAVVGDPAESNGPTGSATVGHASVGSAAAGSMTAGRTQHGVAFGSLRATGLLARRTTATNIGRTTTTNVDRAFASSEPNGGSVPAQTIRRRLTPAPPPISLRPSPRSGPPIPQAARGAAAAAGVATPAAAGSAAGATMSAWSGSQSSATPGTVSAATDAVSRASLVERTAELFRAARLADPAPLRRSPIPGGTAVQVPALPSASASPGLPDVAASYDIAARPQPFEYGEQNVTASEQYDMQPHQLDEIVERVIARIEQRVIDELERRGRRYTPGVF